MTIHSKQFYIPSTNSRPTVRTCWIVANFDLWPPGVTFTSELWTWIFTRYTLTYYTAAHLWQTISNSIYKQPSTNPDKQIQTDRRTDRQNAQNISILEGIRTCSTCTTADYKSGSVSRYVNPYPATNSLCQMSWLDSGAPDQALHPHSLIWEPPWSLISQHYH